MYLFVLKFAKVHDVMYACTPLKVGRGRRGLFAYKWIPLDSACVPQTNSTLHSYPISWSIHKWYEYTPLKPYSHLYSYRLFSTCNHKSIPKILQLNQFIFCPVRAYNGKMAVGAPTNFGTSPHSGRISGTQKRGDIVNFIFKETNNNEKWMTNFFKSSVNCPLIHSFSSKFLQYISGLHHTPSQPLRTRLLNVSVA